MSEYITMENAALRTRLHTVQAERAAAVAEAEATARQRDSALRNLAEAKALVANYENTMNWHTTCSNCASMAGSAYAETVRAERAEARLDLVNEEHQPLTVQRWVTCPDHIGYLAQQIACPMCAERPVQACKAGCGDWPCATYKALHEVAVDGEPVEIEDEITLPRSLYDKLVLVAQYVADGPNLGPRVSAREAIAEIAERS